MNENFQLGVLLTNVLEQKCYSHCRLCLQSIRNDYFARFEDEIAIIDVDFIKYIPLAELLATIFGKQVIEEIPGIEAVCDTCIDKVVESYKFIETFQKATRTLHKIIDDLNSKLPNDLQTNEDLFILCREENSQVILKKKIIINDDGFSECDWAENDQSFDYISDLKGHNSNTNESYPCDKCEFTTYSKNDLKTHKVSTEMYKCDQCPNFLCTKESLKDHINSVHTVHVCKECGKSYNGLKKLRAHEQKHLVKHECPKCRKTYSTKDFYYKHVKLCVKGLLDPHPMRSKMEKTYFCEKCGKGYSTQGGLRVHERFTHENAEPHICSKCGKSFTAPSSLKAHLITHSGEKNFPCNICGGKFVSKGALLYHTRRHTGEKPYPCDMCDEKFVNASARVDHIKHKHIGPTLSCEYCTRKFVTKNFLRLHLKKHLDPSNKIYIGRSEIPPNVPGIQNMRIQTTTENDEIII